MPRTIPREVFEDAYSGVAPWDIGRPQRPILGAADRIVGPLLDAGCGLGDTAMFFAERGLEVTGIDFADEAIRRASDRARERGLSVRFLVRNALELEAWDRRFASAIDTGLFHVFSGEDRRRYVAGLHRVIEPGGRLFLMCGSANEPRDIIPRVSREEIRDAFAPGWAIESIEPVRYELNPTFRFRDLDAPAAEAQGWFAIIRRVEPS